MEIHMKKIRNKVSGAINFISVPFLHPIARKIYDTM